jgi:hypothetical protein
VLVSFVRLLPSPKVEHILTWHVFGEFGLTRLETFSEALVECNRVIIWEDDWNVSIEHT